MERVPRRKTRRSLNLPGHAHELTFCCYRRQPLLVTEHVVHWLIRSVARAREALHFDLWGYVVMPEHVHLLVRPREEEYRISAVLKKVKWPVARLVIRWAKQNDSQLLTLLRTPVGKNLAAYRFWEAGGGYDRNITSLSVARSAVACMHANPVRRGLVTHPCDWPWSSAQWYAGLREVPLAMDDMD
jgi:putative transposase